MKPFPWFLLGLAGSVLLTGCGQKAHSDEAGHDHSEHADAETGDAEGVTFKAGRGLQIAPVVARALNLRTTAAAERPLAAERSITAHVFALQPRVLASARLPVAQATTLEQAAFTGAKLVRLDHSAVTATRLVDLIFELPANPARQIGDFVTLALTAAPASVLTVPRSAVLDAATGVFVYVVNGDAYLRTPVTTGVRSTDFIEITDGLYDGDVVVETPIDQLWLAELRLTKGGGHSH